MIMTHECEIKITLKQENERGMICEDDIRKCSYYIMHK